MMFVCIRHSTPILAERREERLDPVESEPGNVISLAAHGIGAHFSGRKAVKVARSHPDLEIEVGLAHGDSFHQDREERGPLPDRVDLDVFVAAMQVAAADAQGVDAGQSDVLKDVGITHATGLGEGQFVTERFRLDLSNEEASRFFQELINESVSALFPQLIERLHTFAQWARQ